MIRKQTNFQIKKLNKSHLDQLLYLQSEVHQSIRDPSLCELITSDEFEELLDDNTGITAGIFDAERLIAFASVLFPKNRKDNLGNHLDFRLDVFNEVFHIEICNVHPNYQGNSLQSIIMKWLIQEVKLDDRYRYLCATCAPENIGSIKNLLAVDTVIVKPKEMYGGFLRYIFFQDIHSPIEIKTSTRIEVRLFDADTQMEMFAKGYLGIALDFSTNAPKLIMALPIKNRIPVKSRN